MTYAQRIAECAAQDRALEQVTDIRRTPAEMVAGWAAVDADVARAARSLGSARAAAAYSGELDRIPARRPAWVRVAEVADP